MIAGAGRPRHADWAAAACSARWLWSRASARAPGLRAAPCRCSSRGGPFRQE